MDVATGGLRAGIYLARAMRGGCLAAAIVAALLCVPARATDPSPSAQAAAGSAGQEPYMLWPDSMSGRPIERPTIFDQPSGAPAQDDVDQMMRLPAVDQFNETSGTAAAPGRSVWSLPSPEEVSLAAYAQDTGDGGNKEAQAAAGGGKPESPEALGKAPVNNTLQFLRRQTILLAPGQHQFDIGYSYSLFNNDFPVGIVSTPGGPVVGVARERIRQRIMFIPTELRYGVTDRTQVFFDLSVGWANSELSFPGSQSHSDILGLGDTRAGFSTLVRQGCGGDSPDVVLTVAGTAPTGNPGNPLISGINTGNRLGQGFWQFQTSLLFVHTYDPLVVFYGCGYVHRFGADIAGNYYQAGEEFDYQCGVGFAVNPTCTVSGSFAGAYVGQWQFNHQPLLGSTLEVQRMRFALTMVKCQRIVEPFAEIGMTVYSPTSRIGITWTF